MKDFNICEAANHKIIICAHRGVWGGNIPNNTIPAYEIALSQGADMLETDVTSSIDGELFIFHPRTEKRHLNMDIDIRKMTADEVKKLRWVNYDGGATEQPISTLDEFLECFKDRCYINIDKFWDNPVAIMKKIKDHNMADQIIVKSKITKDVLSCLEEYAPDLQYLAITSVDDGIHEYLKNQKINYVGLEILFENDSSPLISVQFIEKLHKDGKVIFGNSILYSYKVLLSGQHSDDVALVEDKQLGWGFFPDHHYDIIQTDWPYQLSNYLKETGRLYR